MTGKVHILTARPHRLLMPLFAILGDHIARGEQAILLVPEQLTLEMERKLLQTLQLQGFFDVDVLSPSRLYERVLDAAGRDQREPLSSAGRRMAVSLALEKLEDKLGYYASVSLRQGFVEKTSALITDLKRGGMTPELLQQDVDDGAPVNADGTFNLVHYMAWMIREINRNGNESDTAQTD